MPTSPNCTLAALPTLQRWNESAPWATCPNVTLYMGFVGEDARQRVFRSGYQVARVGRFSLSSTIDRLAKAVRTCSLAHLRMCVWMAVSRCGACGHSNAHRSRRHSRGRPSSSTNRIRSLQQTMGWRRDVAVWKGGLAVWKRGPAVWKGGPAVWRGLFVAALCSQL